VSHDSIKLIPVNDQQSPLIRGDVDEFIRQDDCSQIPNELSKKFIVITGCIVDLSATVQEFQHTPHNRGIGIIPVPGSTQTPTINDISDKVQVIRFNVIQKVKQGLRPSILAPKVRVAEENCSNALQRSGFELNADFRSPLIRDSFSLQSRRMCVFCRDFVPSVLSLP